MKLVTDKTFEKEVLEWEGPVLVDFFTTWCGPCKLQTPVLEKLSVEMEDAITGCRFVKLDAEGSKVADKLNVRSVPTLALFLDGEEIARKEQFMPKPSLEKWITETLDKYRLTGT